MSTSGGFSPNRDYEKVCYDLTGDGTDIQQGWVLWDQAETGHIRNWRLLTEQGHLVATTNDTVLVECPTDVEDDGAPLLVCLWVANERQQGWRHPDGTFTGTDGNVVVPNQWWPGPCDWTTDDVNMTTEILCDFGNLTAEGQPTRFMRRYTWQHSSPNQPTEGNYRLDMAGSYTVIGPVGSCDSLDVEIVPMCDDGNRNAQGSATRFFRHFRYDPATGSVVDQFDSDYDGNEYTVIGPANECSGREFESTPWCINGQVVYRVAVRDFGDGSTDVEWRAVDGTLLAPQPTPAEIAAGNPGGCGGPDAAPVALESHVLRVTPGTPWTPALATGTLTGVSVTGVTGTYTVTDSDGTVTGAMPAGLTVDWQSEDANSVVAPQQIEADAPNGEVIVTWTERP